MDNTRLEYNKRLNEIEIYFDTLKLLDNNNCSIKYVDIMGITAEQEINSQLLTILKANGFLLLYNLVESTIRKSIDAVISSMHSSSVTFENLSDELRRLWIKQESKTADVNKIMEIAKKVLDKELLYFERSFIKISGNIDARKIREIIKQVGGNDHIPDGECLKAIKDKRNHLAHGDYSFSDIGKDYTINELIRYKDETKDYLLLVLNEVQSFIEKRSFLN